MQVYTQINLDKKWSFSYHLTVIYIGWKLRLFFKFLFFLNCMTCCKLYHAI